MIDNVPKCPYHHHRYGKTICKGFNVSKKYDTIIVGAGIIGACMAFELAKKGYKTLNVDRLPAAGHGPTYNSCGIVRVHYSTFEGVATAYECHFYWKDWEDYLGVEDEHGIARYINTGCIVTKTEVNKYLVTVCQYLDDIGIEWEDWSPERLNERIPVYDPHSFFPVRLLEDPQFGSEPTRMVKGAIFTPTAGYVVDPQLATHNAQRAAEAKGGEFRFNSEVIEIRKAGDRVQGVTLKSGERIDAPVVVNVAGPHSYIINRLAGVEDSMNIKTKALRQEVALVPSPEGYDFGKDGCVTSDGDIGCYYRPEVGNHILVGSEDPECDPKEWVAPDDYKQELTDQSRAQVYRLAQRIPSLGIPSRIKGIVDLYDVSDDWIPIYDKSDLMGFYMAIGTSGNQFKNAPVVGAMMADLIERCENGHDHDRDPVQFMLKNIERSVNVGFYSRLRQINKESSFSVIG